MGFMDLAKAQKVYTEEPMRGNIERLLDFDEYHCLLSGRAGIAIKLQKKYPGLPQSYLSWLQYCDGGLLFDTVLLSSEGHDKVLDLDFDTYEDMNSEEVYAEYGLPEGYTVFAVRSYGDPICFKSQDEKVYLWDSEEQEFSDIWDTFEDWITEEIDDGIQLIADDALDPLEIKQEGGSHE